MEKFNVDTMSLQMLEAIFITRFFAKRVRYAGAGDYGALWRVPVGFVEYVAWVCDTRDMVHCDEVRGFREVIHHGRWVEFVLPSELREFDSEIGDWLMPVVARWSSSLGNILRVWGEMGCTVRCSRRESLWLSQELDMATLRWVSVETEVGDEGFSESGSLDNSCDTIGDWGPLQRDGGETSDRDVAQRRKVVVTTYE